MHSEQRPDIVRQPWQNALLLLMKPADADTSSLCPVITHHDPDCGGQML